MAEKNSFILYGSWEHLFEGMTDEQAGQAIKAIYQHESGKDVSVDNPLLSGILNMIFDRLDSDRNSWNQSREKRSEAGKRGAKSRWKEEPADNNLPSDEMAKDSKVCDCHNLPSDEMAMMAVNVNVNDTVTVNNKEKDKRESRKKLSADADRGGASEHKEDTESINPDRKEPYADDPDLDAALREYVRYREDTKSKLTPYALNLNRQKLESLAPGDAKKQIAIIHQTIARGWKGFFPLDEEKSRSRARASPAKNQNMFNDFKQRDYDFDDLESKLLKRSEREDTQNGKNSEN